MSYGLKEYSIVTIFLLLTPNEASLQVLNNFTQSPIFPKQTSLLFSRHLNILQWEYFLQYQKKFGNKLTLDMRENLRSTLQQVQTRDLWKDEHSLSIMLDYRISQRWRLKPTFSSQLLSDQLAGFDNDVTFNAGGIGFSYRPDINIELTSTATAKQQSQLEQKDSGYGLSASGQVSDFDYHGYRNNLFVSGQQDFFPQRHNSDLSLRYSIQRQFYQTTGDTLTIFVNRLRRDSFDSDNAGVFVRNLSQTHQGAENRLSYRMNSNSVFFMKNVLLANTFRVNNINDDSSQVRKDDAGFESRHEMSLSTTTEHWLASIGWHHRLRTRDDNKAREAKPDPFGRFPTVGFNTEDILVGLNVRSGLKITQSDSIGLYTAVAKFQYDTSDTTNPNDHDQLRWQGTLTHTHRFSQALLLKWHMSIFLNHFVFISRKFSSGNNWERHFQLSPEIIYIPSKHFYFRQQFLIRAKYQTYDFDEAQSSNRNIVNRQFIAKNSSRYHFCSSSQMELNMNLELAEQGRLFYELWRQRLALSWRNLELQVIYRQRLGAGWQITSGGNFFKQTRWEHRQDSEGDLTRVVKEEHTNFGPIWEVKYRPTNALEVLFAGNIQITNSSLTNTESIRNLDLTLHWFL